MLRGIGTLLVILFVGAFLAAQNSEFQSSSGHFLTTTELSGDNLFQPAELSAQELQRVNEEVDNGVLISIHPQVHASLLKEAPKTYTTSIMTSGGDQLDLVLEKTSGALDNAQVYSASDHQLHSPEASVHYSGSIKGFPNSRVGLSVLSNEVLGIISWGGQTYTLGKLKESGQSEKVHIFYRNGDLLLDFPDVCHVTEDHDMSGKKPASSESSNSDNCIHMYFEVTHDIFMDKGDMSSTLDYINGALSQVKILYENEDINWEVEEILVWDVPDPYDGPGSGDYLVQFRDELDGNYNGDLAHLLGYGGGGGVAYLDVLCNNFWGVAYSGIGSSYNDVPEYSWTVMVISHEIGHNVGAPHTHACAWNGDGTMIDGCGPEAGYPQNPNCPIGPLPPSGGTVMSYCHLIGGVGIDLGEGFHPQVADLFMDEVSNATCLGPCNSDIPTADFGVVATDLCEGATVQFYSLASENTTDWDWSFPGGSPSSSSDEHPVVTYNNAGNYNVTLEVTSAAGETDELELSNYIAVDNNGSEILVYEDFENGLGDYSVDNPAGPGFETTSTTSGSTYGESVLWLDNFNNTNGAFDDLLSPSFSLLAYNSATLFIDYAVTRRSGVSDSLVVYASRDGGTTFEWVVGFFEDGNESYSTHFNTSSSFVPESAEEWCLESPGHSCLAIDLSDFTREDDVQFRIRNKHMGGNNLYIDRLWVETDCYDLEPPTADFVADPLEGCVSMVVNFTDLSSEFPQSHDWSFDGGIPATSSDPNPTVIYDEPGEYAVTLSVTNPEGTDSETKLNYIVVGDDPTADFDIEITDRTIDLNYTGLRADVFDWDFGDGNGSNQENPTHTYGDDGLYTVVLEVSNDCGTAVKDTTIEIATPPQAEVDISVTEGCEPLSVFYDASESSNTDEYYWSFDGGDPSTSDSDTVTVVYEEAGVYDVLFVASNDHGDDTLRWDEHIQVNPQPYAEFSTSINDLTVTFFNLSVDYDDVFWDFGDGQTTSSDSPEHTYDDVGTYDVELVASNSCGSDTFSLILEVYLPVDIGFSANPIAGCATMGVQFSNTTLHADSFLWSFPGGNPTSSVEEEPFVFYEEEGLFDVQLIAWNDQFADTLLLTNYIEVNDEPTANFSYTRSGSTVTFMSSSVNANDFEWDFGDGNSSNEENPIHEYQADGEYTVILTAINDCGSSETIETITINSLPFANFTADPQSGCTPFTVDFTDMSSANTENWEWIFESGSPSTSSQQNPSVEYSEAGWFEVTLIASSSAGSDTMTVEEYIEVIPLPTADFDFTRQERTVSFTNESIDADSYVWNFGDGQVSTEVNPTHDYEEDGSYSVELAAINDCDTSIAIADVIIATLPTAEFIAADTVGCGPITIQFDNLSSENSTSFLWSFPGGNPMSSVEANPEVTYSVPGVYDVSLVAENDTGTDTFYVEALVEVSPTPEPSFDYEVDSLTVNFTNSSEDAEAYYWDFGDGNSDTLEHPQHTYSLDSSYTVTLTAINECDSVTTSRQVGTGGLPRANFSLLGERLGCVPYTVTFVDESEGFITDISWEFEGGNPETMDTTHPVVTYEEPGVYSVTLIVYNDNGSNQYTLQDYIRVVELPEVDFIVEEISELDYSFNSEITGEEITEVFWDFGDGNTSTALNPTHTYSGSGDYDVVLTATNPCGTDTAIQTLNIIGTHSNAEHLMKLQIFPNPAQDRFFVRPAVLGGSLKVYDAMGRVVLEKQSIRADSGVRINSLPNGMYYVHIYTAEEKIVKPLVVHR